MNPETSELLPVGPDPAASRGVVRVGFRYAAPSCRSLTAGHLQGPAKHVTTDTDHLLSLVTEMYQRGQRHLDGPRRRPRSLVVARRRLRRRLRTTRPRPRARLR